MTTLGNHRLFDFLKDEFFVAPHRGRYAVFESKTGTMCAQGLSIHGAWDEFYRRVETWGEDFYVTLRLRIVARTILESRMSHAMAKWHENGHSKVWSMTMQTADYIISLGFPEKEGSPVVERVIYEPEE